MQPPPYQPISQLYKKKFGGKTYTLPLTISGDCPNRRGLKGMQTCIFCDEWGSAAHPEQRTQELHTQIKKMLISKTKRYNASIFLAYFQAYTSSFLSTSEVRQAFDAALCYDEVKGIVVGTRPDFLSHAMIKLWNEYSLERYFSVELGVQSFFDHHLEFMRRGHTKAQSLNAIQVISNKTKASIGLHLIIGSPNETLEEIRETAGIINDLPIESVKLHNLHVLTNTPLETQYHEGKFTPFSLKKYSDYVLEFLAYLDPRIAVQRLTAQSTREEELVAPKWTSGKFTGYQYIIDRMNEKKLSQGARL